MNWNIASALLLGIVVGLVPSVEFFKLMPFYIAGILLGVLIAQKLGIPL